MTSFLAMTLGVGVNDPFFAAIAPALFLFLNFILAKN